jgi:hypothetical protein
MMNRRRAHFLPLAGTAALVSICVAVFPLAADAHGFGERYDLPLPLSLFVIAGAAAVALSFVVAAVFLRAGSTHSRYPRYNLLRLAPVRWLVSPPVTATLKTLSVALTVYVIVGALVGNERAALNPAPAAIYVAFWVGLSFFTALFGNLWALVNPWKAAWGFLERVFETIAPGSRLSLRHRYPPRIGPWPAALVFVGFAILETVAADAAGPRALGWILVLYTVYNFAGMYVYGREVWLRNAEGFTVVYGFMARFSITEIRAPTSRCRRCTSDGRCSAGETNCVDCYECFARASPPQREFNLRPPCVGLNRLGVVTLTVVFHVILLLSTVSFDGLSATPEWLVFTGQFLLQSPRYGGYIANLIGVLGIPVVFGLLFAVTCGAMVLVSGQAEPDTRQLLRRFTFSLLPIALAYHFAHFLGFLFINGQRFIVLASDPFGWGWDLFGTADAIINIGILSPVFIWYFSILAIVVGHIAGVYLAHVQATRIYSTRRAALLSQVPMLALMVCYTCASLWIISRPIAE